MHEFETIRARELCVALEGEAYAASSTFAVPTISGCCVRSSRRRVAYWINGRFQ
jgi:hypothetical protein